MIILGIVAGIFTSLAFIPQIYKAFHTKSVKDLSWGLAALYWLGILLWLIYGLFLKDITLICANCVSLCLSSLLIFAKIKYSNGNQH